jgi:hypothetical protein
VTSPLGLAANACDGVVKKFKLGLKLRKADYLCALSLASLGGIKEDGSLFAFCFDSLWTEDSVSLVGYCDLAPLLRKLPLFLLEELVRS